MRIGSLDGIMPYAGMSGITNGFTYEGNIGIGATGSASPIGETDADSKVDGGMKSSPVDCKTCRERKYIDGSDENVSFKAAAHISPQAAGAVVRGHEGEHVSNAYDRAAQNNGKVINASVSIHTAVCPECGRTYVSGGTTTTTIQYSNEQNPYQQNKKATDAAALVGGKMDFKI
jgi:hypothetical protein